MEFFKERRTRKVQTIIDGAKIEHMIGSYLVGNKFFLKNSYPPVEVDVIEFDPGNGIIVECEKELTDHAILYRVFNKYMDAPCVVKEKFEDDRYLLDVTAFNIATSERKQKRLEVTSQEQVSISNIRAARNTINASLFNIPTSVKVHLSQYELKLKHLASEVAVRVFDKRDEVLELVRKSGKTLWLEDTQEITSYIPDNDEDFIDYRDHLATETAYVMDEYRKSKIISELIVPIIYIGHDGKPIPLGYIRLVSKSDPIDIGTVLEMKALSFEIVDRIRESNTMLINTRQSVANISKSGLQLQISDDELKTFLIHQKGMSFDIVFKLQAPITVSTNIIYVGDIAGEHLILGVQIIGTSSRPGEIARFEELLNSLASSTNQTS